MDKTKWVVTEEPLGVRVNFDLTSDESCFIELFFTKEDVEQLMHMDTFGNYGLELEGIRGSVSRKCGDIDKNNLAFAYRNGGSGNDYGTVYYNHRKLKEIMTNAIEEIWKLERKV
ncbi:hypothetical protein BCU97_18285 [Vibrio splendidus]|uniref:hypothetical protein n=1 Tax=Vibrio splendidus TaxID=29497 RepID=UPI000C849513|nr:hypothetical protein [Vibrio splendidus]PMG34444.1 hypothetical protein BCU97_18285 [Vibrio splendidus]